jgi:hypothetical protein
MILTSLLIHLPLKVLTRAGVHTGILILYAYVGSILHLGTPTCSVSLTVLDTDLVFGSYIRYGTVMGLDSLSDSDTVTISGSTKDIVTS